MAFPFQDLWLPAVRARFVLFVNHVMRACPPALQRLQPHAGKVAKVDVAGWPGLVPVPPPLILRVTPAGLFEAVEVAVGAAPAVELSVTLDTSQPARLAESVLKGGVPPMTIEGDAAFAADFSWIAQNVRWDPAADAERFFGPFVAEGVSRAGAGFARAAEAARDVVARVFDTRQPRKP